MNTFIIVFLITALVSSIIVLVVSSVNIHKLNKDAEALFDNKLWLNFISNIDKFTFVEKFEYNKNGHNWVYKWKYGNYDINVWVKNNRKDVPYASIHTDSGECVLCSFNEKRSEEMARKLLHLLWDVK